jgi:hypothetical protein
VPLAAGATEITDKHPYAEITTFVAAWRHLEGAALTPSDPLTGSTWDVGHQRGLVLSRPDGRDMPAIHGVHRVPCLRRRGRVAKDIEVYAHYGHEGGVDYQVDWQLSWFVECFPGQG